MDNKNLKRERFIKIAENRTNKIITMMKLLGNCSNKNNYSYQEDDVKQIISALENELKSLKLRFQEVENNKKEFKLR